MNIIQYLSTKESKEKKWIDAIASIIIGLIILAESLLSNGIWGTKSEPYVKITPGHIIFPILAVGLNLIWFLFIRKYNFSYFGIRKAGGKFWYFIAPFGVILGFGFGIPGYLLISKFLPFLKGGGMAGSPPELNYPLYIVLLVETIKYPLVSVIPHNITWRGSVYNSVSSMGKKYGLLAFLISTGFYASYHLSFDFSFSALYFNLIWNLIAIFLLIKSKSLFPPMIFHAFINYAAIFMSWGYYNFK